MVQWTCVWVLNILQVHNLQLGIYPKKKKWKYQNVKVSLIYGAVMQKHFLFKSAHLSGTSLHLSADYCSPATCYAVQERIWKCLCGSFVSSRSCGLKWSVVSVVSLSVHKRVLPPSCFFFFSLSFFPSVCRNTFSTMVPHLLSTTNTHIKHKMKERSHFGSSTSFCFAVGLLRRVSQRAS